VQKGYIPLTHFYKIWLQEESQAHTLMLNFTNFIFKMWAYSAKNHQNCYFWYKFVQKGCIPISDFYHIWLGEGSPRSAPSYQIALLWAYSPQNRENGNFSYKLARKGKFKVDYRCTTTNLPLFSETIIVFENNTAS